MMNGSYNEQLVSVEFLGHRGAFVPLMVFISEQHGKLKMSLRKGVVCALYGTCMCNYSLELEDRTSS